MKPLVVVAVLVAMNAIAGCQSGPKPEDDAVRTLSQMIYPAEAPWGDDLDIVVVRKGSSIVLSNRTPRSYENVTMWLNQQYVAVVDKIEISPNNLLPLRGFINKHGESFPVAGFLAPDRAATVVSAELILPDEQGNMTRHTLNVRYTQRR